jgi:hypothetical protein
MWTSNRASPRAPQRTPSVHSVASVTSNRPISMTSPVLQRSRTGYESDQSSEFDQSLPPMWQVQRQQSGSAPMLNQKLGNGNVVPITPSALKKHNQIQREAAPRTIDDDATSRSSTLDGNEDGMGYPEKAPKSLPLRHSSKKDAKPHVPGPLESQLAALMSKLIYIEQENPTVSVEPEEYQEMKAELKALKEEKKTWTKRHEAIWALRDEDVENNIKIRVSYTSSPQFWKQFIDLCYRVCLPKLDENSRA